MDAEAFNKENQLTNDGSNRKTPQRQFDTPNRYKKNIEYHLDVRNVMTSYVIIVRNNKKHEFGNLSTAREKEKSGQAID